MLRAADKVLNLDWSYHTRPTMEKRCEIRHVEFENRVQARVIDDSDQAIGEV